MGNQSGKLMNDRQYNGKIKHQNREQKTKQVRKKKKKKNTGKSKL